MFRRKESGVLGAVVLLAVGAGTVVRAQVRAQETAEPPSAIVTALAGGGATRDDGVAIPVTWNTAEEFQNAHLKAWQSVVTAADGMAVLRLSGYDTVLHLGDGATPSELKLENLPASTGQEPIGLSLPRGRVLVVQKSGAG